MEDVRSFLMKLTLALVFRVWCTGSEKVLVMTSSPPWGEGILGGYWRDCLTGDCWEAGTGTVKEPLGEGCHRQSSALTSRSFWVRFLMDWRRLEEL